MKHSASTAARTALRYTLVPLLAMVALTAWGLSSPVGSSPDEDFHLSSIWCGQGIEDGVCEPGTAADERRVPEALPRAPGCYAFQSEVSAACQDPLFRAEVQDLFNTGRGNFTGLYPPGFYMSMHAVVADDLSRSVVAMRVLNSAIFVGLMTALYWLLPPGRRRMVTLGTAVSIVPLGVFIIPSVNPSSWAVTSSAVLFPAMVGFFETTGRRRVGLAAIAGAGTLLGAGARADAAVYAAIAIVLAVIINGRIRAGAWRLLAFPLLLGAVCAAGYLSADQSGAASVGLDALDGNEGPALNLADQIGYNLLHVPELWAGALGSWGLGWLDTEMPSIVWVANLAVFGAVLYLGNRQSTRRKAIALILAVLAAWLVPTLVLVQSSAIVGQLVQPRYVLPLLVIIAQVALFKVRPASEDLRPGHILTIAATLTITNAIALHYDFRRYLTGTDLFQLDLDAGREWWWAIPISPMTLWLLGSLTFGAALVLTLWPRTVEIGPLAPPSTPQATQHERAEAHPTHPAPSPQLTDDTRRDIARVDDPLASRR